MNFFFKFRFLFKIEENLHKRMSDTFQILVNNVLTDIGDLKVAQLKVELKKRGLSTAGNKQDLYEKLKKVIFNSII